MTLQEGVKWLGIGLLFLLVGFVLVMMIEAFIMNLSAYDMDYSFGAVPLHAVLFLFGYALYRSARSLAPLNRLPRIEPETNPSSEAAS